MLLADYGNRFNREVLEPEVRIALEKSRENYNPWHRSFVLGLIWGRFAKNEANFLDLATRLMSDWNEELLSEACSYHREHGVDALRKCLSGGRVLFKDDRMPDTIPSAIDELGRIQASWLGYVLRDRPPFIGVWNAAAPFMVALLTQRSLWTQLKDTTVVLPPGGAVHRALHILHRDGVTSEPPAGGELDDSGFEPGVLYENQGLMQDLLGRDEEHSLVDIHSGLYLLGERQRN